jgi:hypothetical protein
LHLPFKEFIFLLNKVKHNIKKWGGLIQILLQKRKKPRLKSPDKERTPGKWKENNEAILHTIGAPLVHFSHTFRAICSAKGVQKPCEMFAKSGNYRIVIYSAS